MSDKKDSGLAGMAVAVGAAAATVSYLKKNAQQNRVNREIQRQAFEQYTHEENLK